MTEKILVIDDGRFFSARLGNNNLQEEGYEVLTASSGEEGPVHLLKTQAPHLVITEYER